MDKKVSWVIILVIRVTQMTWKKEEDETAREEVNISTSEFFSLPWHIFRRLGQSNRICILTWRAELWLLVHAPTSPNTAPLGGVQIGLHVSESCVEVTYSCIQIQVAVGTFLIEEIDARHCRSDEILWKKKWRNKTNEILWKKIWNIKTEEILFKKRRKNQSYMWWNS